MADGAPDRIAGVMRLPVRVALRAYEHRLRQQASHRYELELLLWAVTAPHQKQASKPPQPPRILQD